MSAPTWLVQENGDQIAYHKLEGSGPTVLWLGGFRSDMEGAKAVALAEWARKAGRACLRFDYFGHGQSSGAFENGSIGQWRADALAVIDQLTDGPIVLVGSSMGGWLGCLCALARPMRIKALVLIAPAIDFTSKLMEPSLGVEARAALKREGRWTRPSEYDGDGYVITAKLLEEGRSWSILPGPVLIHAPVHILQGVEDPDVPWRHALSLVEALESREVVFTLIKDGDHRLSRPTDLQHLIRLVEMVV